MPDTEFWMSAISNDRAFMKYYRQLTELAVSTFEWHNLPATIDPRFLELSLYACGQCVFFRDEEIGELALRCTAGAPLDVYNVPITRHAYAPNGYRRELNNTDSVLIYNNYLRTNSMLVVEDYARQLWDIDRVIQVNLKAQKTPVLILCDQDQRLTMQNLYKQYDGNIPFIFGNKKLNPQDFTVLKTDAPFVAPSLYDIKSKIWNEALTFLGISNVTYQKKERLNVDEVNRMVGGAVANRYSRLEARRIACKKINQMFGLDVWVDFRDVETSEAAVPAQEGAEDE